MATAKLYARLLRAARGHGRTQEDAEDLVQEAYRRLIEYRRNTQIRDVHNLAINQFHHRNILRFVSEPSAEIETAPDDGPSIEHLLSTRQQLEQVAARLAAVNRRTCEIFLAYRAGFGFAEIAEECGVSTRTVKKHISRAKSLVGGSRGIMTKEQWADACCLKGYPRFSA
jgi:RNA polymerase sigma factor (sigma-70 family)